MYARFFFLRQLQSQIFIKMLLGFQALFMLFSHIMLEIAMHAMKNKGLGPYSQNILSFYLATKIKY